uniref:Uncharacterized protein n=1 Tax=Oryza glumipatula TaxID=40148 RepID=A0A0E0BJN2_9ORYZ
MAAAKVLSGDILEAACPVLTMVRRGQWTMVVDGWADGVRWPSTFLMHIRMMATEALDGVILEAASVMCEWQRCIFSKLMTVKTRRWWDGKRLRGALWAFKMQQLHKGFLDGDGGKQT